MEKNQKNQEALKNPKEMAAELKISTDLLRKWTEEFNITVETTNGGHRRYNEENVKVLQQIREKIQDQNWSWKQVNLWLSGSDEDFMKPEEKSGINDKLDRILEQQEKQMEFNKMLLEKLQKSEEENIQLRTYIREQLPERKEIEERDKLLVENLQKTMEEREEKKQGFWSKLFGG